MHACASIPLLISACLNLYDVTIVGTYLNLKELDTPLIQTEFIYSEKNGIIIIPLMKETTDISG